MANGCLMNCWTEFHFSAWKCLNILRMCNINFNAFDANTPKETAARRTKAVFLYCRNWNWRKMHSNIEQLHVIFMFANWTDLHRRIQCDFKSNLRHFKHTRFSTSNNDHSRFFLSFVSLHRTNFPKLIDMKKLPHDFSLEVLIANCQSLAWESEQQKAANEWILYKPFNLVFFEGKCDTHSKLASVVGVCTSLCSLAFSRFKLVVRHNLLDKDTRFSIWILNK